MADEADQLVRKVRCEAAVLLRDWLTSSSSVGILSIF